LAEATLATFTESNYVYVVDDDPTILESTAFLLTSAGYQVRCFPSGAEFLKARPLLPPGAVLLDLRMPEIDGLNVIAQCDDESRLLYPVIMMTGHGDLATAVRAMKLGADDFLEKPFGEDALVRSLDQAENLARAFVEPVLQVLRPVFVLCLEILLMGAGDGVFRQSRNVVVYIDE